MIVPSPGLTFLCYASLFDMKWKVIGKFIYLLNISFFLLD
jgi:hypothetical protein